MKQLSLVALALTALLSCNPSNTEQNLNSVKTESLEVKQDAYELSKPAKDINAVLVLFGGYPEKAEDIKREFNILEAAKDKGLAIVFMNYNQKLWLEDVEKQELAEQLEIIFSDNQLPRTNSYIGGFSSGGNVALSISQFLSEQHSEMTPKGVFVVDSPIDLLALYRSSEKNVERNFSDLSVQESNWILETLGKQLGNPYESISNYEKYSIFTSETDNFNNIKDLRDVKIRFYSEPDTVWWKENRMADYDQMNAYYLARLADLLKKSDFKNVEYITTENKCYRANGDRHPHSWSIVDPEKLIEWIMD
jgi:hypothetical protein